ncbi:alpha/beta fold hydrolase [Candidatus Aquiluna sp. UB-MaderosW2red]|jgi:pimeloyl-ACP methyl ester carboxylesterase|uniref:alpha/beta fold hydrolase n=1 Tax=Candidatus Aquiluna sp. UB-MaderosW2red TaxID=1855377 RepID=UPI000875CB07|nr:alpha/beta hydrolase [Candidatus Aquiluna sp. UB-MaderosW2red]SCX04003.1 Pimeloyl-ACP methyl ester carboxylesterase [Candidatus Aquiluna sp. UB-MaderosW2red]
MKKRSKIILGSLLAIVLVGPFLLPVGTSGTLDNKAAAELSWGAESKFVEVLSHEVHYVESGSPDSDRLILLLHGFGASSLTWKPILEPLGEFGHVIAYDRAAFGFTDRPTSWEGVNPYSSAGQLAVIDSLIDKFGQGKKVVIIGHSAGGALALGYALDHPNTVTALVLEAPAVYETGGAPDWLNILFKIPQLNHVGPLLVSSIAESGLSVLDQSYNDKTQITQETRDNYTAPLRVKGWERGFWEFNKADKALSLTERLSEFKVRTLVITGDNDQIVATDNSIRLSGEMPSADLTIIPNAGHLPNEEKPKEFLNALIGFLEQSK